jgi:hypothetical protein
MQLPELPELPFNQKQSALLSEHSLTSRKEHFILQTPTYTPHLPSKNDPSIFTH